MRNCFNGSIFVVVVVLVFSAITLAQTAPPSGAAKAKATPDLSGVWDSRPGREGAAAGICGPGFCGDGGGPGGIPRNAFLRKEDPQPSMQPWAEEKYKANREGVHLDDSNIADPNELDPRLSCFPPGPTQFFTVPEPFEIRQFPDVVLLLFEADHWVRRIYTDGRGHPDGYPISWMGHSIGKYDGDTLVVNTVDINDKTWLDGLGHPHSEALHLVERFRRMNHDTLEIDITFDDPKAYTKPWTGKKVFRLMPPGYEIMERVTCEEYLELGKHR